MSNKTGREINLLEKYPKPKRDISKRENSKSPEQQLIARKFDKEFFDGDRSHGYGGYYYNEKFWTEVIKDFINYYELKDGAKILDIGCGTGISELHINSKNFELTPPRRKNITSISVVCFELELISSCK